MVRFSLVLALGLGLPLAAPCAGHAAEDDAELARKLANPVADIISLPLQNNYDCCYGPSDGWRYTLKIQPVIPVPLNDDWKVIVRTIIPLAYEDRTSPAVGDVAGLQDITQSFFLSPRAHTGHWVWGVGPAFVWPIGSDGLSGEKWGAGPTGLLLYETKQVTVGVLTNHIWSYAGEKNRPSTTTTLIQPFYNYHLGTTTISINSEASYNWKSDQWTIPVNFGLNRVFKFGDQRVQLGGQAKIYAASENAGPQWGLRFTTTFTFPRP